MGPNQLKEKALIVLIGPDKSGEALDCKGFSFSFGHAYLPLAGTR